MARLLPVDLTNAGCGGELPELERVSGAGEDPVPWTLDAQRAEGEVTLAAEPKLSGKLANVTSLRVNAKRTCLAGTAVAYDIESDSPATVSFSDGRTLMLSPGRSQGTLAR